jgi:hypothetical protein
LDVNHTSLLDQLHRIGENLRRENRALRKQYEALQREYGTRPFQLYNRWVNQALIGRIKRAVGRAGVK